MTDNLANAVADMAGVAVMGAVALKTIDMMDEQPRKKRHKKKHKLI